MFRPERERLLGSGRRGGRSPEFTLARDDALASINVTIPRCNVVTVLTNYLLFHAVHDARD